MSRTTLAQRTKAERLELRLTTDAKSLLANAARMRHTSLSEFILSSAVAAAEDVVAMPRVFFVGEEGWEQVVRMAGDADPDVPEAVLSRFLRRPGQAG